jgi:hypothetical protein
LDHLKDLRYENAREKFDTKLHVLPTQVHDRMYQRDYHCWMCDREGVSLQYIGMQTFK